MHLYEGREGGGDAMIIHCSRNSLQHTPYSRPSHTNKSFAPPSSPTTHSETTGATLIPPGQAVSLEWMNNCGSWWSRSEAQLTYDIKLKLVDDGQQRAYDDEEDTSSR